MGAILTNDEDFAFQCRLGKNNGRNQKDFKNSFVHKRIGLNMKSNDIMASIANIRLKTAREMIQRRQEIAKIYYSELYPKMEVGPLSKDCSYLGFPIICASRKEKFELLECLERCEVEARSMFPLIPDQPSYHNGWGQAFPVAQRVSDCGLYVPCHQYLSDEQVKYVIQVIKNC